MGNIEKMKKKKVKKIKKKLTIKKAKDKCWKEFSIFIRTRDCLRTTGKPDWGHCISCGRLFPFKKLQAGHFVSGRNNANLFYEKGCHIQCMRCNIFLAGNVLDYMDSIIKLYGKGIIKKLRDNDKKELTFTVEYLEKKRKQFINKTEKLLLAKK